MSDDQGLVVPIVHPNGTGIEKLMSARDDTWDAIGKAYAALKRMAPNGRDYYLSPGLLEKAQEQHMRRLRILDDLKDEIAAEMREISGDPFIGI